jgi:hypothetical protein
LRPADHRSVADAGIPTGLQAGHLLELVAGAGEEEVVDPVDDRKGERAAEDGRDGPLRTVARLMIGEFLPPCAPGCRTAG